jgi:hypothetical protein
MLFIAHRVNTSNELKTIPTHFGVEIDIRDKDNDCVLQHDPFYLTESPEKFEDWLKEYKHALLICNIKSEGVEWKVIELLKKYHITNYFFLDSSIPMIQKLLKTGETNIAIRYSEVEPIEFVEKWSNKVKWCWIDCFTHYPPHHSILDNFKCCYVSPALQGRTDSDEIRISSDYIKGISNEKSAVCDKIYHSPFWTSRS